MTTRNKLQHPLFDFTISLTMDQPGKDAALKGQRLNLWTPMEHVFTLILAALPLYSFPKQASKLWDGRAARCKVSKSEHSLTAALPEEQKQKSPIYL